MWLVITRGGLPDESEQRHYDPSAWAWNDYHGRIRELEIDGFVRDAEDAVQYGRRWVCNLTRGIERITVAIERAAT